MINKKYKYFLFLFLLIISCGRNLQTDIFFERKTNCGFDDLIVIDSLPNIIGGKFIYNIKLHLVNEKVIQVCKGYIFKINNIVYLQDSLNKVKLFNFDPNSIHSCNNLKLYCKSVYSENYSLRKLDVCLDTLFYDIHMRDYIFKFRFKNYDIIDNGKIFDLVLFVGKSVGVVGFFKSLKYLDKTFIDKNNIKRTLDKETIFFYKGNIYKSILDYKSVRFGRVL